MHRLLNVLLCLLAFLPSLSARTAAEKEAAALARRIVPAYAGHIRFLEVPSAEGDYFQLESRGKRLYISGNDAGSMAAGLGWYLSRICHSDVSWLASDPVEVPRTMPAVPDPVRIRARAWKRYFFNYCTFGYTMPWWQWEDWERMIDWMALHGVNLPLAITGQEKVWKTVWQEMGLTQEEIDANFTGPAFLPWNRMSNIDGYAGPLPEDWIEGQAALQKKILERERALGMTPVLPGFQGHVPAGLRRIRPGAAITEVSRWCRFPDENRCSFLSPTDPLYAEIQKAFLEEQTRLFGTDHIYSIDLFNEVDPPSWEPEVLAAMARNVYASLAAVDPEAVWLQSGWMLYNDRKHWTPEIDAAYLGAVPKGKMLMLDYYVEAVPVWPLTESFSGQPFLLCYLGNFGGNTRLSGPFRTLSERLGEGLSQEGCAGVGCTLEGFGINRWMYEYVLSRAWDSGESDEDYLRQLADSRLGRGDPAAEAVWRSLADSVYVRHSISESALVCAEPCHEGWRRWTTVCKLPYERDVLVRAWKDLLTLESDRASYRKDCITIGCQVLGNHFERLRYDLVTACYAGNQIKAGEAGQQMREILKDISALAAVEPELRMSTWMDAAAAWGRTPGEKALYRRNARLIVSSWGPEGTTLRDYGSRLWAGLIDDFYAPRWEEFISRIQADAFDDGAFDPDAFEKEMTEYAYNWAFSDAPIRESAPASDWKALCLSCFKKYDLLLDPEDY